jgi:hypothetical protein
MCGAGELNSRVDTRENFIGQPLKVELYEKQLEAVVGGRSKKTERRLHGSSRRYV